MRLLQLVPLNVSVSASTAFSEHEAEISVEISSAVVVAVHNAYKPRLDGGG
ncbi:MAG: hypothetical protein WBB94_04835 [Candidatus Saccharimonadaceae bacterium]